MEDETNVKGKDKEGMRQGAVQLNSYSFSWPPDTLHQQTVCLMVHLNDYNDYNDIIGGFDRWWQTHSHVFWNIGGPGGWGV